MLDSNARQDGSCKNCISDVLPQEQRIGQLGEATSVCDRQIAHGHGDVRYAHYGLDIFPHDSNYTIGSMAKLLRDLEGPPKSSSRELFVGSGSTALFFGILKGVEMCEASLASQPKALVPATALPPILNVQMDNATGDNKNRYVYAY